MNNIMVMRTINNTNNLDGPETYIVNENFKVVRKSKFNDKNIEVFTDELFNNGVSVLVSHSMETSPIEVYNKYLKIQKENNEYEEAQKAYKESAYDEKCDYWKNYAQKTTTYSERFG
jgi:ABC-type polysaccharide/polyol phosphate transport system ATPase subunit